MENVMAVGIALSLYDKMSPLLGKSIENLSEFEQKVTQIGGTLAKWGTVSLGAGMAMTSSIGNALASYQDLAKAQGEISSLGIDDSGIKAITKSATEFSNAFAGTSSAVFVKASYDIKSGISSLSDTAVGEFTKIAAMTGVATKSSTGEMTSLFATGFGIYRKQFDSFGATTIQGWDNLSNEEKDIKFGEYFSSGIANAVQAFKTDGANMSAALSNLGASATSAGIGFAEQLSILGKLQETMSGSEAATKYRAFLGSAMGASEKLGLTFTDSNNKLLSMPEILEQIKGKYGDTIDALESDELKKAFGTDEAVSLIKLLYGQTGELTSNINNMNQSLQQGTAKTQEMAKAMNKGREFDLLGQQMNNLTTLIGQAFAPAALLVADTLGGIINSIGSWVDENEELAGTIGWVIAGITGFAVVFGTLGITIGGFMMLMPTMITGLVALKTAFFTFGGGIAFVGKMMALNPIGFAITAIAAGAYLIYRNWDTVKGFFLDLWSGVTSIFWKSWDNMKTILSWSPLGLIVRGWGVAFDWFSEKFDWLSSKFETVGNIGKKIGGFFGFGEDEEEKEAITSSPETTFDKESIYKKGSLLYNIEKKNSLNIGSAYQTAQQNGSNTIKPTLANAQSNINNSKSQSSSQTNNINVVVHNPSSDVDIQRAIRKETEAMKRDNFNREIM